MIYGTPAPAGTPETPYTRVVAAATAAGELVSSSSIKDSLASITAAGGAYPEAAAAYDETAAAVAAAEETVLVEVAEAGKLVGAGGGAVGGDVEGTGADAAAVGTSGVAGAAATGGAPWRAAVGSSEVTILERALCICCDRAAWLPRASHVASPSARTGGVVPAGGAMAVAMAMAVGVAAAAVAEESGGPSAEAGVAEERSPVDGDFSSSVTALCVGGGEVCAGLGTPLADSDGSVTATAPVLE